MEIVWKIGFWFGVLLVWLLIGMATDPTAKAERRKRKQEKLAMDFHTTFERGAPRNE